ncbi:MAG: hypothetical protein ACRDV4_01170 [Acidimicrobiales bacterium]
MSALTLAQRVSAIKTALSGVPHAFGGALALAYYAEPRATIDIDVNVFVPVERVWEVFSPLGQLGAAVADPSLLEIVQRDGQARVMWDATPVDLFFAYDSFHDAAGAARRVVPFGAGTISILAPEHLIVCKAVFNRARDWVDINSMLDGDVDVDPAEVLRWVARLAGDDDPRFNRIVSALTRR